MLSKVTLLAASAYPQSGSAAFLPLTVSDEYVINTKNIVRLKVYSTTDTELLYLFGDGERCAKATLRVDEAYSVHVANAIAVAANNIIALTVKINEKGETLSSSETWYVNQDKIFLAYDYKTDYTKVWISKGGGNYEAIVVEESLDEIITLADSGS